MSSIVKKRVFVGMSGGVDSSVAAYLLKKEGYDVTGIYIHGYNVDGCAEKDAEDARRAAEHIGIPFYALDLREEYFQYVVEYMIDGYKRGLTPNPDVMCNKEIKFGIFLEKALMLGADYIATGHYVRLSQTAFRKQHNFLPARKFASLSPRHPLLRSGTKLSGLRDVPQDSPASPVLSLHVAKDGNKDQSYFLWTLTQEQLKRCLFPVGEYTKQEVRTIAKKAELPNAERKDSQGICFLGKVKLPDFLKEYIKPKKGDVVDTEGNKVGEHNGAQFYTIGQRHIWASLKVKSFPPKADPHLAEKLKVHKDKKPYYVVGKDVKNNVLVVAEGSDNPALFRKEIFLIDVNFISSLTPQPFLISTRGGQARLPAHGGNRKIAGDRIDVLARVRYRQPLFKAVLVTNNQQPAISNKRKRTPVANYRLLFPIPVKFIAPGQSAVFYSQKGEMLGGGIIGE